jgi:hypothetical protein
VCKERGKKGERERETYEWSQGMKKKKRLRRIIISKLNFLANRFCFDFLLMLKSGERGRLKWREKMRVVNVGERERERERERRGMRVKDLERKKRVWRERGKK